MNKKTLLFGLMLGFLLVSCKKEDFTHGSLYEKSYQAWLGFKSANNNTYRYVVNRGSWTGAAWQTNLTVIDGKVTERHFKYTNSESFAHDIPQDQLEWTETGAELNSHQNTSAAATINLDEVYDLAKTVWLKKRKTGETYFETKNNGLISSCGFVEEGCMDDCFYGINITKIEPIPLN